MEETPANDNASADEVPVEEAPDPKAEEAKEEADDTEIVHVNGEVIDDQVAKTNPGSNDQADQDRERVRNAFHLFDIDGNGVISADELGTLLKTLGQNPSRITCPRWRYPRAKNIQCCRIGTRRVNKSDVM